MAGYRKRRIKRAEGAKWFALLFIKDGQQFIALLFFLEERFVSLGVYLAADQPPGPRNHRTNGKCESDGSPGIASGEHEN